MRKALVRIGLVAAAFGGFTAPVQAHEIQTHHGCNYWGVNCDGTLTDSEALWFTMGLMAREHPLIKTEPSYHWVTGRPSGSSRTTFHAWGGRKDQAHKCLIDLDRSTIYATCHFPDW